MGEMAYPYEDNAPIFAYTTNRHLILDMDKVTLGWARRWAQYCQREFKAGDCLIVRSSFHSFHLIFNNDMEWEQIKLAIMVVAMKGIVEWRFFRLRQTKRDLTIRYSKKWYKKSLRPLVQGEKGPVETGVKPRPSIVAYLPHKSDKRCDNIKNYLEQSGIMNDVDAIIGFVESVYEAVAQRFMVACQC